MSSTNGNPAADTGPRIDATPPAAGRHRIDRDNPYLVTAHALLAGVPRTGKRAARTGPGTWSAAQLVAARATS
jgi:hypothetical protein